GLLERDSGLRLTPAIKLSDDRRGDFGTFPDPGEGSRWQVLSTKRQIRLAAAKLGRIIRRRCFSRVPHGRRPCPLRTSKETLLRPHSVGSAPPQRRSSGPGAADSHDKFWKESDTRGLPASGCRHYSAGGSGRTDRADPQPTAHGFRLP